MRVRIRVRISSQMVVLFLGLVVRRRLARRDVVDIRHVLADVVHVVEGERAAGGLHRNRAARALGFFFLGRGVLAALRLGVGAEVAVARRRRRVRIESGSAESAAATRTRTTKAAAGARAAEAAATRARSAKAAAAGPR